MIPRRARFTLIAPSPCGLIQQRPTAEAYLLVEDDVAFCQGLREYLEANLWPADPATIALVSPYCPEAYVSKAKDRPWFLICQGFYLAGSQAWVFPPESARAIVEDLTSKVNPRGADYEIGQWAKTKGLGTWYHSPSLAQHIGIGNSALGDMLDTPLRRAADFVGETLTPASCLPPRDARSQRVHLQRGTSAPRFVGLHPPASTEGPDDRRGRRVRRCATGISIRARGAVAPRRGGTESALRRAVEVHAHRVVQIGPAPLEPDGEMRRLVFRR